MSRPGTVRRRLRLVPLAGAALILSSFAYLLYGGIGDNLVYFLTPSELLSRGDHAYETPVRLGGFVKPGSVNWNAEELDLRFSLVDDTHEIVVHSRGAPPQMFRDEMEVIVEGRYTQAGIFESTNLMVKHSNEYRAPEHGQKPEQLYEGLVR